MKKKLTKNRKDIKENQNKKYIFFKYLLNKYVIPLEKNMN